MALNLKIISPEKIEFDGTVESVHVPGTKGKFVILKDHAPIISSLQPGVVEYVVDGDRKSLIITGGFVEVQKNMVNLCVELK
jgi:F-type H+-transporting ATPase subunit epsilon